jgi:NTP pyrophosphatase (non-canonical NTP hydrolase)
MSSATFDDIAQLIQKHLEERGWENNPPRGLATSIALEASELLEHYQWSDDPVGSREDLASELADIFIYAFQFAQVNQIDIPTAISKKLAEAAKKYPAESFKGKDEAEQRDAWIQAKLNHKKKGL